MQALDWGLHSARSRNGPQLSAIGVGETPAGQDHWMSAPPARRLISLSSGSKGGGGIACHMGSPGQIRWPSRTAQPSGPGGAMVVPAIVQAAGSVRPLASSTQASGHHASWAW